MNIALCYQILSQVLVQFGESRKVLKLTEDQMTSLETKVKDAFKICNQNIIIQKYDDTWEEFIDIEDYSTIGDMAKIRVNIVKVGFKQ